MPQWNCSCPNCESARQGKLEKRTQSSVAISDSQGNWILVNASPDLHFQIQSAPELQPESSPLRNTPISDIFLTNADLDHVLGLFALREGRPLQIHAPALVRSTLEQCLGLTNVLEPFCAIVWHEIPFAQFTTFRGRLQYRAIRLPGLPPPFARDTLADGVHSVAYQFLDPQTGGRLLVAPDVASLTDELRSALQDSDAVLFDGTFWSADELAAIRPGARSASHMGHLTIQESLKFLSTIPARTKAYIHINNTNPVLAADSKERAAVTAVGLQIASDGMEFDL